MGDGPAEVEDGHLVGEPHDQAHVVLDQHDGQAEFGADLPDDRGHAGAFGGVHAGHGFVEQQDTGLQTQGAGEFYAFAVAVRQQRDGRVEVGAEAGEFGDLAGLGEVGALFAPGARQTQGAGGETGVGQGVPAEHQVVGDGALGGDDVLEGAGDAQGGDPVRGEPGQFGGAEPYGARGGPVQARQDVEAGGLAGAVGADDGVHGAGGDGEGDVVEGEQTGEAHGHAPHFERGRRGGGGGHAAPLPSAPSVVSPR